MKRAFIIKKKKPNYAPIMDAVQRQGIEIRDFEDDLSDLTHAVVFHNKSFDIKCPAKIGWWQCDYRKPSDLEILQFETDLAHIFLPMHNYHDEYELEYEVPVTFMPQHGLESPKQTTGRYIPETSVFIGNVANNPYHHNREQILAEIRDIMSVRIIGGEKNTIDQGYIYGKVPFSINITLPNMAGCSNRLYNILASGGLCVTTWFEGIERLFENNKHLIWFKEVSELKDIIPQLLVNEYKMHMIRNAGNELYRQKHTAQHRIANMFSILEGKETEFRGYL